MNVLLFNRVLLFVLLFVGSGILSPLLIMQVKFSYEPPASTLWPLYPLYIGNLVAGAFSPRLDRSSWSTSTGLFFFDAGGQVLSNLGLLMIGPPLYAIFYKSVTVFTGVLSLFILPRSEHPTSLQWIAILVVTSGLLMQGADAAAFGARELAGAALVLTGCLFYAGGAVVSSLVLGPSRASALHPLQVAWVMGVEGSLVCAVIAACTVRAVPLAWEFWLMMAMLVVSNAAHQAAWFVLVGQIGACATAMLKAFQSVCLFLAGSAMFCHRDQLECLTFEKLASFAVVSFGVLLYALPTDGASRTGVQRCGRASLASQDACAAGGGTFPDRAQPERPMA